MEQLFTSSVENALEAGLVQYDQVFALDGTKLNAYASIQKTKTKEELAKVREGILASVKEYFDRCEEVDSKEDETFGESDEKRDTIYQDVLSKLKSLVEKEPEARPQPYPESEADEEPTTKEPSKVKPRKEVTSLDEAQKALDKCSQIDSFLTEYSEEDPDEKRNMTDPESKMMKSDSNIRQRYNAQVISNKQLIVAAHLTNEENDQNQLSPMVDQLKKNLNTKPPLKAEDSTDTISPGTESSTTDKSPQAEPPLETTNIESMDSDLECEPTTEEGTSPSGDTTITLVADAGYNSGANLKYLDRQEGMDSYISMHRRDHSELEEEEKAFLKENFEYDESKDEWICPSGRRLENYGEQINQGVKETIYASTLNNCQGCSFFSLCVRTKGDLKRGYRTIRDNGSLIYRKEMKTKMSSDRSKQIYSKRSGSVEPIFGQMKYNQRIRGFAYRGLEKFKSEFFTLCLAHNLGKMLQYHLKMGSSAVLE